MYYSKKIDSNSELWSVVKPSLVTHILVWAGGFTNKKPKSNVFETKGWRPMMCADQEPQNVFEARVETDTCARQGAPNQTCLITGAGDRKTDVLSETMIVYNKETQHKRCFKHRAGTFASPQQGSTI